MSKVNKFNVQVVASEADQSRYGGFSIPRPVLIGLGYLIVFVALECLTGYLPLPLRNIWYPQAGLNLALLLIFGLGYAPLLLVTVWGGIYLQSGSALPLTTLILFPLIALFVYSLAIIFFQRVLQLGLKFHSLHETLRFALISAFVAFTIALLDGLVLGATARLPWADSFGAIARLGMGYLIGILGVTPFLLTLSAWLVNNNAWEETTGWLLRIKRAVTGENDADWIALRVAGEGVGQVAAVLLILWLVFHSPLAGIHLFYLCFLPLLWICLRYGLPGASAGLFFINSATVLMGAVYVLNRPDELQTYMLVLSVIGLLLGAVITESRRVEAAHRHLLVAEHNQRQIAETLADVTLVLTSQTSPAAVLNEILRQVQRLIPYRTAHIVLLEGDNLRIAYWQGYQDFGSEKLIANLVQPLSDFPLDAEVIHSRKPLLIPDTRQEPRWVVQDETAWVRSHIVFPISVVDRVLGLLRLDADAVNAFSTETLKKLHPLINSAAIALENARLFDHAQKEIVERKRAEVALQDNVEQLKVVYEQTIIYAQELNEEVAERKWAEKEIRRRNRELALLNRVITASAKGMNVNAILDIVCRELALAFDVPQVTATLFDQEKIIATPVAECLADNQLSRLNTSIPLEENALFRYLIHYKSPFVSDDQAYDSRLTAAKTSAPAEKLPNTSLLLLPLIVGEDVTGCISIESFEPRHFSSDEIDLAWRVADQVAGAMARARFDQERRQLSAAIEQSAEGVVITNTEGEIVYVNPAFERISGYPRQESINRNLFTLLRGDSHVDPAHRKLLAAFKAGEVWQGRLVNRKKDGTQYTGETTVAPVRNELKRIVNYVSVLRDVTRELQLEEQYRQAQKMEAIGRLTGGIAHDFNNLLTAINGFAETMQYQMSPDDPMWEVAGRIRYTGQRAAGLIEQLMAFSRKSAINPRIVDLNTLVADTGNMLQPIIGRHIKMETHLASDLWTVRVDPVQAEQILVNLAVNARDAMPNGGNLIIKTTNVALDQAYADGHFGVTPGDYVLLSVIDSGMGIPDEVKSHIFEPFFTTKGEGKGSGLGLATIFGIVEQSNGHIDVESEVGKGTAFKVYLPRVQGEVVSVPRRIGANDLPRGTETVLVVEDELAVRNLAARLLERQGYTVLGAANSEEAVKHIQTADRKIDLLLTDMIMPDISGQALAGIAGAGRPDLKVLFMSGNAYNRVSDESQSNLAETQAEVINFIQKPFSAVDLVCKVREVLDGSQAG